jgi:hypothetical protein
MKEGKGRESECEKRNEWDVPVAYQMQDLGLPGCDNDLCHLVRFASMFCVANIIIKVKGKGKVIPLQAWTGPERSRSLRLPDFKAIGT